MSTTFLVVSHDSIRGCVRPSVGRSVRRLVRRLVRRSVMLLSRRAETSRRTIYFVYTNLLQLNLSSCFGRYAHGIILKLHTKDLDSVGISGLIATFEGAEFIKKLEDEIELRIPANDLHRVFTSLETAKKNELITNYSIAEMTMDQV